MKSLNIIARIIGYPIAFACVLPLLPIVALMHLFALIDTDLEVEPAAAANAKSQNYQNEPSFFDEPSFDSLSFPMAN